MAGSSTVSVAASAGTLRPMLRLALPALLEYLLHALVQYVDLWLTGQYIQQVAYVAAITLAGYVMWFVYNLFSFFALGATALTARFIGAEDRAAADRAANQAILGGLCWCAALMALGFVFIDDLVGLLNLRGAAAAAATGYMRVVLLALPAIAVEEIAVACLRGAGDMVTGLYVMSLVNVVNAALSAALLLGLGPFPALGWYGLAIGTAAAHAVGGAILLALLIRGRDGYRLRLAKLRPDFSLLRRLLRVGLPGGVDMVSLIVCQMWFVSIIAQLGDLPAAAHGVGVRLESLAFLPGSAFQVAAATLAGQYLGAKDYGRATRSVLMACLVGGALMGAAGLLFYFAAEPLCGAFLGAGAEAVIPLAARLLRIVAPAMVPLALSMVLGGALRGAGDTRWPLAFTFVGLLGVRIPLAYLLAHDALDIAGWTLAGYGLGVVGAWYAMVADICVRCGLVGSRFLQGGWRRIEV